MSTGGAVLIVGLPCPHARLRAVDTCGAVELTETGVPVVSVVPGAGSQHMGLPHPSPAVEASRAQRAALAVRGQRAASADATVSRSGSRVSRLNQAPRSERT